LADFRNQQMEASQAAKELGLSPSRFYELFSDYLAACASGHSHDWSPGTSGGDHHPDWPTQVVELLRKLLSSKPPCSYSAATSELLRRLNFKTNRASVRRWALQNRLAPDTRFKTKPKPVKRWQARDLGALWQYDASPHCWLPGQSDKQVLLNILDDATRYNTGARLYPAENLLAHLDFLSRVFKSHGLPLALYVDYHSFFFTNTPETFTQLGTALHFYGVALLYAPTPQAKGKIERRHDFWQKRLPPLFAAEDIRDLENANKLLDQLLPHVNLNEIHRELGTTPHAARTQALAEKRSALRQVPACPWWPYVWSLQTKVRVGDDSKVPVGSQRLSINAPPRSTVVRCLRPDGDIFFLRDSPHPKSNPILLLHHPVF
jgi:transposase InsO family protein